MELNDKCLLVLKPSEPMHQWLTEVLQASHQELERELKSAIASPLEVSLDEMQTDASCYIIPALSPDETTTYLEKNMDALYRAELNIWCPVEEVWPTLDFGNFVSSFKFNFYFDWMNFQKEELVETQQSIQNVVLLVKPEEPFKEYLRTLFIEKYTVPEAEVNANLDLRTIQDGSTVVITDIASVDDIETFLEQHAEEIFRHQLLMWGGEDTQSFWPNDLDLKTLKEWFSIEIHRHTHLMLH